MSALKCLQTNYNENFLGQRRSDFLSNFKPQLLQLHVTHSYIIFYRIYLFSFLIVFCFILVIIVIYITFVISNKVLVVLAFSMAFILILICTENSHLSCKFFTHTIIKQTFYFLLNKKLIEFSHLNCIFTIGFNQCTDKRKNLQYPNFSCLRHWCFQLN